LNYTRLNGERNVKRGGFHLPIAVQAFRQPLKVLGVGERQIATTTEAV